ncbi:MAG: NADPH:quinone oxidoreductase family protein [Rhodospirillales bacterium]|nr:NADPH:quinone oxidoreductase family protein [Rhodospirillales bacterium]
MRAVLCRSFDGHKSLVVDDVPSPTPGPGQVRIAVKAAGLNFADTLMTVGQYQAMPPLPFSPGLEGAGVVVELGAGVEGLAVGDRVIALSGHGMFAEEAIAPAMTVFKIPDSMDFETAASFVVAYGTSHFGLKDKASLRPGDVLLVTGAAGGVGLTAVEVGKQLGATVIAVAGGADKVKVAAEAGADFTIDYRVEDIRERVKEITEGKGANVLYDPVGGSAFDAAFRSLALQARILIIGFASGDIPKIPANILLVKNMTAIGYYWGAYHKADPEGIRRSTLELMDWFEAGRLKPHISHRFPMEEASAAMDAMITRKSTGKVVLTMG